MKYLNKVNKFYKDLQKAPKQGGQAMIVSVLYFLFISFSIISGFVSPAVREVKNSTVNLNSKNSYFFAESGSEDVIYKLKNGWPIDDIETLTLNSSSVNTSVTDIDADTKRIVSLGDLDSYQRQVTTQLSYSVDVPFYYGVQVGLGGVSLTSSTIIGNVYANGPITGDSASNITGTAISASSASLAIDQSHGSGTPTYNRNFGDANSTQDIAQSFVLSSSGPLNKAQLYLKRVSSPGNLTVKVVNNTVVSSRNVPGSTVLATGTIAESSLNTTSYVWADAVFTTNPTLDAGTIYWLVADVGSSNANRYYVAGATDSSNPYTSGNGLTGQNGSTWYDPYTAGYDHFFRIYLGGLTGLIAGSSGSQWNPLHVGTTSGTAQANTVNYTNSTGLIYCQNGTGNNQGCVYQADPTYIGYPISESTITSWKDDALAGGVISGDYNLPKGTATIGPTKIEGNLTVGGGGVLTVAGTLWVTGDISLTGGSQMVLSSSYGSASGVIINDGTITIGGGSDATGSGDPNSYIMLLSTSSSTNAVSVSGGSGAVIIYAHNGTVNISGGASLQEVTSNRLVISGNSTVTYNSGLQSAAFSSGPTGGGTLTVPRVSAWKETE